MGPHNRGFGRGDAAQWPGLNTSSPYENAMILGCQSPYLAPWSVTATLAGVSVLSRTRPALLAAAVVAMTACSQQGASGQQGPAASVSTSAPDPEAAALEARERERSSCAALRSNLQTMPALPGTPALDEQRQQILGRAKGSPIVFVRPPAVDRAALSPYMRTLADGLSDPRRAFASLKTLRSLVRFRRADARAILLPEGYFYADSSWLAQRLVMTFTLQTLFDEPELWILRGSDVLRLERAKYDYRYADGPEQGQPAALLLFDRIATDRASLFPPLHLDFVPVSRAFGFDRMRIERITAAGVNAAVRYGPDGPWIESSFTSVDGRASLACEIVPEDARQKVAAYREERRVVEHATEALRSAVQLEAAEQLPFDEPREEVGQQDGSLRPAWNWAYEHGWPGYRFNNIYYPVFDTKGRPHPPQVCIDFVLDTYERAAGTWYQGLDAPRERVIGKLDFERLDMPNRRSVDAVVSYFRDHPGMFDVWDLPEDERIRMAAGDPFYEYIAEHADRIRVGDVVLIHGPRGHEAHFHSFFVVLSDPVTGMPVELAENAGKPRVRSWYTAMLSGPLRAIKHVMRPRVEWLRQVFGEPDRRMAGR